MERLRRNAGSLAEDILSMAKQSNAPVPGLNNINQSPGDEDTSNSITEFGNSDIPAAPFDNSGTGLPDDRFNNLSTDAKFSVGYNYSSLDPSHSFNATKSVGGGSLTTNERLLDKTFGNLIHNDIPVSKTMGVDETKARIGEMFGADRPMTLNEALNLKPKAPEGFYENSSGSTIMDGRGVLNEGTSGAPLDPATKDPARDMLTPSAEVGFPEGISSYDIESANRDARAYNKPDFNETYSNRQPGVMSMEQAVRLAGGNRNKARQMIELQKMGYDPVTGLPKSEESPERGMTPLDVAKTRKTQAETLAILNKIGDKGEELNLTDAEKARDKKFGTELAKWETGGAANTESNISSLEEIVDLLEDGQIKTRGVIDALPFGSDWARSIINPGGQDALDRVRGVVFQSLRETLGAQFTEREGQRFVEASYNPRLSQEQNADRLKDYVKRLKAASIARNEQLQYLKENGTLQGYSGKDPEELMRDMLTQDSISGDIDIQGDIDSILDKY